MEQYNYIIALGSSLGDKKAYLEAALSLIVERIGSIDLRGSLYETAPVGGVAEHSFLNSAVMISTSYSPNDLLSELMRIEADLGRDRKSKWDDRTIDLDIILAFDEDGSLVQVRTSELQIPHPLAFSRDFVMQPVYEILANHFQFKSYLKQPWS